MKADKKVVVLVDKKVDLLVVLKVASSVVV